MINVAIPFGQNTMNIGGISIFTTKVRYTYNNGRRLLDILESNKASKSLCEALIHQSSTKTVNSGVGGTQSYMTFRLTTMNASIHREFALIIKKAKIADLQEQIDCLRQDCNQIGNPEDLPWYPTY